MQKSEDSITCNEIFKFHALERSDYIMAILKREKVVLVNDLSRQLNVSEETIRNDLKKLEKEHKLRRVHGGAYLNDGYGNETPFSVRSKIMCAEKALIAQRCLPLIRNRDTIFLDSSSTAYNLAKAIFDCGKRLTVITNSLEIARVLATNNEIRLVLLGGEFQQDSLSFQGDLLQEQLSEYYISTAFISATGVDLAAGITDSMQGEARVRKTVVLRAAQYVLLADETKFQQHGPYVISSFADVDCLVSDAMVAKVAPDIYEYMIGAGKTIIDASNYNQYA